ncbi:cytochrome P450 [Halalkalicoccus salilacus]|uniref:cytochrome P450 n=1 Tax=Halalkalicoccus TaxID=332246 RepID=UPI002F96934E
MPAHLPSSPARYPLIGHALQFANSPFDFVENSVTECGDAYRMVLPAVDDVYVLCHPDYYKDVLVTEVDSFTKTTDFREAFGSGLLSTDGQQWREQRDMLQPLFYRDHINGFAEQMVTCTQRRLDSWNDGATGNIEVEMRDLTFEILFATLFGQEIEPGERAELRTAADNLNEWFVPSSWMLPNWVPTPARRRFKQSKTLLREEVQSIFADSRGGEQTDGDNLLSQLFAARQSTSDLSMEEIEDHLMTMVFAGYETTATALAFAWYSLSRNPDIRQEFHDELEAVLGGRPPSYDDLAELDVTDRIIKETLRQYPPIHTIPRQTATDIEFAGVRIPEGKEVHLSIIHTHRDQQFYDEPQEFKPDRWTGSFEDELHDFAYIPFGAGRRTCIGREFSLLESKIVLATIGQQFRLEWEGNNDVELEPQITINSKNGIQLSSHKL